MAKTIALVGPVYPYRGGIAHFTTQLGQELRAAGYSVNVISFSRQYPALLYPGKTDKDPSMEHPVMEARFLLDPLYPWTWLHAARVIKESSPIMVLIQWWTTFWGPALLVLAGLLHRLRIPVVFIIHNVMPHEERFFDRWIAKITLSNASACISLSSREEDRLRRLIPVMKIFKGHLPIAGLSEERISKTESRLRLYLPEKVPVLLFFGIVRPYKGLHVLIQAIGILAQIGIRPHLLIAGEFWEDIQQYQNMIALLGLSDQVKIENRFIPNEETALYFSAADLFVAPYIGGTQSAVIKVAMSYHLPILASDRIAADLPVKSYPFYIHPAGDADILAKNIEQAINQPVQQNVEDSVINKFGWDELVAIIGKIPQSQFVKPIVKL